MTLTPDAVEQQIFSTEFRGYHREEVDSFLDRVVDTLTALRSEHAAVTRRLADLERLHAEALRQADERVDQAQRRASDAEAAAARRVREVESAAAEALEAERMLKRTLVTAQRTADATIAEARQQADGMVAEARQEAEVMVAEARDEAAGIRAALDEETTRVRAEAAADAEQARREAADEAARVRAQARRQAEEVVSEAQRAARQHLEAAEAMRDHLRRVSRELADQRAAYAERVRAVFSDQIVEIERLCALPPLPPGLGDDEVGDLPEEPGPLSDLLTSVPRAGRPAADSAASAEPSGSGSAQAPTDPTASAGGAERTAPSPTPPPPPAGEARRVVTLERAESAIDLAGGRRSTGVDLLRSLGGSRSV